MNKNINAQEVSELAGKLIQIQKVIQLQNHHLDFIPPLRKVEEARFSYEMVYRSLVNMHEVNQDLIEDLDNIALRVSEIADELEK